MFLVDDLMNGNGHLVSNALRVGVLCFIVDNATLATHGVEDLLGHYLQVGVNPSVNYKANLLRMSKNGRVTSLILV